MANYTRYLMSASAAFMAALGLLAIFLPQEALAAADMAVTRAGVVLVQVTGALYLGFAILNHMARAVLIGGIYARPLAMGNFMHFAVAAITLLKTFDLQAPLPVLPVTAAYALFAIGFGLVVFTHPLPERK